MGSVMIMCPETNRPFATGLVADAARFRASPVFFARAFCPHCRANHEWFAGNAWVDEHGQDRLDTAAA
jgi:hypothetical protein